MPRAKKTPTGKYCQYTSDKGYCCTSTHGSSKGKVTCSKHEGLPATDAAPFSGTPWMQQHMQHPGYWSQNFYEQTTGQASDITEIEAKQEASRIASNLYPGDLQKIEEVTRQILSGQSPPSLGTHDIASTHPTTLPLAAMAVVPTPTPAIVAELEKRAVAAERIAADTNDLRVAKGKVEAELAANKSKMVIVEADKASLQNKIVDLERMISDKKAEIALLASDAVKPGSKKCITDTERTALNGLMDEMKQKLILAEKARDEAVTTAEKARDEAIAAAKATSDEAAALAAETKDKAIAAAISARDEAVAASTASDAKLATAVEQKLAAEASLAVAIAKVSTTQKDFDVEKKKASDSFDEEKAKWTEELRLLNEKVSNIKAENAKLKKAVDDTTAAYEAEKNKTVDYKATPEYLALLKEKSDADDALRSTSDKHEKDLSELQTKTDSAKAESERLEKERVTLDVEITRLNKEIERITKGYDDAKQEQIEKSQRVVDDLEEKIKNLDAKIEENIARIRSSDAEVNRLTPFETKVGELEEKVRLLKETPTPLVPTEQSVPAPTVVPQPTIVPCDAKELADALELNETFKTEKEGLEKKLREANQALEDAKTAKKEADEAHQIALAEKAESVKTAIVEEYGQKLREEIDNAIRLHDESLVKIREDERKEASQNMATRMLATLKPAFEAKMLEMNTIIADKNKELEKLDGQSEADGGKITELESQLVTLNAEKAELDKQLQDAIKHLKTVKKGVESSGAAVNDLLKAFEEAKKKIVELQSQSDTCSADLEKANSAKIVLDNRIAELEQSVDAKAATITSTSNRVLALEKDISDLKGAKIICDDALANMKAAKDPNVEHLQKISTLEESVKRIQVIADKKTQDIETLEALKKTQEEEYKKLSTELASDREFLQKASDNVDEIADKLLDSNAKLETCEKRIIELSKKIEDDAASCDEETKKYREQIAKDAADNRKLRDEMSALNTEITELRTKISTLEEPKPCDAMVDLYAMIITSLELERSYLQKILFATAKIDEAKRQLVIRDLAFPDKEIQRLQNQYALSSSTVIADPANCKEIGEIVTAWQDKKETVKVNNIHKILLNIFEDGIGAVRVYVRVKTLREQNIQKAAIMADPQTATVTLGRRYGPFYSVFSDPYSNIGVYTGTVGADAEGKYELSGPDSKVQGMHTLFSQIQDGYTVVLFGYGLSGSGKSYTLFGSKEQKVLGIVQIGLGNMQNVSSLNVAAIMELYTSKTTDHNQIQGSVHVLHTDKRMTATLQKTMADYMKAMAVKASDTSPIISERDSFETHSKGKGISNISEIGVDGISALVEVTDNYRASLSREKRIKRTPLNKESSRSHLIYIFRIAFDNSKNIGHLIVMDMAGKEDGNKFKSIFLANPAIVSMGTLMSSGIETNAIVKQNFISEPIINGVPSSPSYNITDVVEMLKEGIYINETIFQLSCFLVRQSGGVYTPKLMKKAIDEANAGDKKAKALYDSAAEIKKRADEREKLVKGLKIQLKKDHPAWSSAAIDEAIVKQVPKKEYKLTMIDYTPYGAFTDPNVEYERIRMVNAGMPIKQKDSLKADMTCMMPLLFMFKTFSGESKPTKYVMICNIRQEDQFADQTANTLEFADTVKST